LNLLDENFPADQLPLLKEWGIHCRRVGEDVGRLGIKDLDIIPLLHQVGDVTFFTQDRGFFSQALAHPAYCLVWLDVSAEDVAFYVRRLLKHAGFDSHAKRMGLVVRVHHGGIHFWRRNSTAFQSVAWPKQ